MDRGWKLGGPTLAAGGDSVNTESRAARGPWHGDTLGPGPRWRGTLSLSLTRILALPEVHSVEKLWLLRNPLILTSDTVLIASSLAVGWPKVLLTPRFWTYTHLFRLLISPERR